jgi:O-methyltransferase involved in polyketide biosynthesis
LLLLVLTSDTNNALSLTAKARKFLSRRPQGKSETSIPTSDEVAKALNVRPGSHAPRIVWRYSWKIHGWSLPFLHVFDQAGARDFDYSLKCLWCKALAGRDKKSPVYDDGIAYDMLPSGSRRIVKLPNRIFPRLIHFNIELRTAYLDNAVRQEIATNEGKKIRLITLGAGYDARSVRFLTDGVIDEAWELDITDVLDSKAIMLDRLLRRRPSCILPTIVSVDLNDVETFRDLRLSGIVSGDTNWHTIFLLEGVMIYLDEGIPDKVLSVCSNLLHERGFSGSLVFADLLRGIPGGNFEMAKDRLGGNGWQLVESLWCVKPGLARHMGTARVEASVAS